MTKSIIDRLTDLVYNLDNRPAYVDNNNIHFELAYGGVKVQLFGGYEITINREKALCGYHHPESCSLGYADMEYAIEIIDNRDEIMDIVDEWVDLIKDVDMEDPEILTQIVMEKIAPKFESLTGCSFHKEDVSIDNRGLIHIGAYESAGWNFDTDDPENFWFENIDSYSYQFVDFDEIVELMEWVAENVDWKEEYIKLAYED